MLSSRVLSANGKAVVEALDITAREVGQIARTIRQFLPYEISIITLFFNVKPSRRDKERNDYVS